MRSGHDYSRAYKCFCVSKSIAFIEAVIESAAVVASTFSFKFCFNAKKEFTMKIVLSALRVFFVVIAFSLVLRQSNIGG